MDEHTTRGRHLAAVGALALLGLMAGLGGAAGTAGADDGQCTETCAPTETTPLPDDTPVPFWPHETGALSGASETFTDIRDDGSYYDPGLQRRVGEDAFRASTRKG